MKHLNRPKAPLGLDQYDYKSQTWNDLSSVDKRAIRRQLVTMQGSFCAYCEGRILGDIPNAEEKVKQHIEHFHRKGKDPKITFQWENLFLSCWDKSRCGRLKDSLESINYSLLIKPDEQNPEEHLAFELSGRVRPRSQDSGSESFQMATETIRVFGLGGEKNSLRYLRKASIDSAVGFRELILDLVQMLPSEDEEEVVLQLIDEELEHLKAYPYYTAIKHSILPDTLHLVSAPKVK